MHVPSELVVPLIAAAAIYIFVLGFLTGRLWERQRRRRRSAAGVPPGQSPNGDPRLVNEFAAALMKLYGELVELDHSLLRALRGEMNAERPALPVPSNPSGRVKERSETE